MSRDERIDALTPDPENLRVHSDRNLEMIRSSITNYGVNRPIVMDENGVVLAGNGVLEAARAAGITKVKVVEVDGNEIVAVQVDHLTEDQKREYAVADNRAGELSEWDTERLREFVVSGSVDVGGLFFDDELQRLIGTIYKDEETRQAEAVRTEKMQARERRLDAESNVVMCPHCYHEWTPEPDGGSQ